MQQTLNSDRLILLSMFLSNISICVLLQSCKDIYNKIEKKITFREEVKLSHFVFKDNIIDQNNLTNKYFDQCKNIFCDKFISYRNVLQHPSSLKKIRVESWNQLYAISSIKNIKTISMNFYTHYTDIIKLVKIEKIHHVDKFVVRFQRGLCNNTKKESIIKHNLREEEIDYYYVMKRYAALYSEIYEKKYIYAISGEKIYLIKYTSN